jgi:hypothetical protein
MSLSSLGPLEILFGSIFGLWLLLTVLFQFKSWQLPLRSWDPLFMLPSWSFFAPVPNTSDYLIFIRYESFGVLTPWRQPAIIQKQTRNLFWEPARRTRKVVIDISQSVAETMHAQGPESACLSAPYMLLIQLASNQPEAAFATGVQVAIAIHPSHLEDFELFFQSNLHMLDRGVSSECR